MLAELAAVAVVLIAAQGQGPQYNGEVAAPSKWVEVRGTREAPRELVWSVATLVDEADKVYREELSLLGPEKVLVRVSTTTAGFPNCVTNRRDTLFVVTQNSQAAGYLRRDFRDVGVICRCLAELYNPHRVPGLDQYLARFQAVPVVAQALGEAAWPKRYDVLTCDGPKGAGWAAMQGDAALQHPDAAAAAALQATVDKLDWPWLMAQLAVLDSDGDAAFRALRDAAVADDETLALAFKPWEVATDLQPEADGSLLLWSFEGNDMPRSIARGAQAEVTGEWASDGQSSLQLTYTDGKWPMVEYYDPDWRCHDWRPYRTLEFDVQNPGGEVVPLVCAVHDAPDRGHGWMRRQVTLMPGKTEHFVLSLEQPPLDRSWTSAVYFDGRSRLGEICEVVFHLSAPEVLPVTIQIDNVRLVP